MFALSRSLALPLVHISPFMQPISDSMHMEISAVRKPAVLCQDPPQSLMRLCFLGGHFPFRSLLVTSPPIGSVGDALSLGVAANELFLASSLVAATCECRSPLGCGRSRSSRRGHLARIQPLLRLWLRRWRLSQWHSERARLISRHTWCDRERREGRGTQQITVPNTALLPFFPPRFSLFFKRNFNLKGQLEEEEEGR